MARRRSLTRSIVSTTAGAVIALGGCAREVSPIDAAVAQPVVLDAGSAVAMDAQAIDRVAPRDVALPESDARAATSDALDIAADALDDDDAPLASGGDAGDGAADAFAARDTEPACPPLEGEIALPDQTVSGTFGDETSALVACLYEPHAVRRYRLVLSATTSLEITGTTAAVALRAECDAAGEFGCNAGDRYDHVGAFRLRRTLEPGAYDVLVAGAPGTPYSVRVRAVPTPSNATCSAATPLSMDPSSGATSIASTDLGRMVPAAPCGPPQLGQEFFTLTVPPGQRAVVHAGNNARNCVGAVRALDACDATRCAAYGAFDNTDNGAPFGLPPFGIGVDNRDAAPRALIIGAGSGSPLHDCELLLAYTLVPLPATVAPNAACDAATPLVDGTHLAGEDSATATQVSNVPGDTRYQRFTGKVLYYSADLPAGATLTLRMARYSQPAIVMRVLDHCGDSVPLASALSLTGGELTRTTVLTYTNAGPARRVVIEAGPVSAVNDVTYDLDATIRP